jgi:hypothetical protein
MILMIRTEQFADEAGETGSPSLTTTRRRLRHRTKTRLHSALVSGIRGPTTAKGVPHRKGR